MPRDADQGIAGPYLRLELLERLLQGGVELDGRQLHVGAADAAVAQELHDEGIHLRGAEDRRRHTPAASSSTRVVLEQSL